MKLEKNAAADEQQLSKKAPKPKKEDKAKKKGPSVRPTFLLTFLGSLAALVLTAVVATMLYQRQVVDRKQEQLEALVHEQAEAAAKTVAEYFKNIESKPGILLNNPLFLDALSNNDIVALTRYRDSVVKQVPGAVAAQFIRRGEAALNDKQFPPLRFSEFEMIGRVEAGASPAPEAIKVDKKWFINYMLPILDGKQVLGTAWVTTDVSDLPRTLNPDDNNLGQYRLIQSYSAKSSFPVVRSGMSDLTTSYAAPLAGTQWQVEFIASSKLAQQINVSATTVYIEALACGLVGVLLLGGIGYYVGRSLETVQRRRRLEHSMRYGSQHAGDQSGDDYIDPMYQTKDILDVKIKTADEKLLGMDDEPGNTNEKAPSKAEKEDDVFDMAENSAAAARIPEEVFRAYDIRGIAGEQIDKNFAQKLGQALGSEAIDMRIASLVVGRDARTHSPEITEWIIRGILSTGCSVINIGTVPTPLLYFAIETLEEVNSGVMVTASHNSAKYSGFKIVLNGVTRSGDDIKTLRTRMLKGNLYSGQGQEHRHDVIPNYIDTIFSDVALAGELSVVVDAGNAVPGIVAPKLFEELGCRVIPLYCNLDGNFPNHDPDPSRPENLQDLIEKVKEEKADLGIALDGDGDRLTVVTPKGEIIWADRLLMAFAKDIISRNPGADVVFDVKCSRHLNTCITNFGGRPIMWKTGHALMKEKMVQSGALVGGEYSGHIFIKDRWFGFDDGMYAAARLLEILSLQGEDADSVFNEFPTSLITPEIRVEVGEKKKFELIEKLKKSGNFGDGRLTLLDGVRADYSYGWGLVRASNTGPDITLRFEADDEQSMHQLKSLFVREIRTVDSSIQIDWNKN